MAKIGKAPVSFSFCISVSIVTFYLAYRYESVTGGMTLGSSTYGGPSIQASKCNDLPQIILSFKKPELLINKVFPKCVISGACYHVPIFLLMRESVSFNALPGPPVGSSPMET